MDASILLNQSPLNSLHRELGVRLVPCIGYVMLRLAPGSGTPPEALLRGKPCLVELVALPFVRQRCYRG